MTLDARTRLLLVLTGLFVAALVVGDLVGCKLVEVNVGRPWLLSMGIIPFPLTFLLTDLLNEFYGKQAARMVTWVGLGAAVFTLVVLLVVLPLPFAPLTQGADWPGATKPSFDAVFGSGIGILVASIFAFVAGQLIDIAVFSMLKHRTQGRLLWLRATGSTAVSQLVDTVVIQTLVWSGPLSLERLVTLVVSSYVVKLVVAVALTPLIYAAHRAVEQGLGIEPLKPSDA